MDKIGHSCWYTDTFYGVDVPFGGDLDQIYFQGHPRWMYDILVEILVKVSL